MGHRSWIIFCNDSSHLADLLARIRSSPPDDFIDPRFGFMSWKHRSFSGWWILIDTDGYPSFLHDYPLPYYLLDEVPKNKQGDIKGAKYEATTEADLRYDQKVIKEMIQTLLNRC